jgi:steroid delta-isomerase-like uncharacterized protein
VSVEANKDIVQQFWERIWNRGELSAADELVTPDFILYLPGNELRGPEGVKTWANVIRGGLPDVVFKIEQSIGEGDTVATRWTARGTNTGVLMGVPPTGKVVNIQGISMFRLADGRITEDRAVEDVLGLLQQLGVVPPLGPPK